MMRERIGEAYNSYFLVLEFIWSLVAVMLAIIVVDRTIGEASIVGSLDATRQALYTALAAAGGSLLGFILTSASIIVVFGQGPRFDPIRRAGQYGNVFDVYFQAILWLAVAVAWAIIGLVADVDKSPKIWFSYVMLWLVALSALRVWRCVWLLQRMVAIATAPASRS